MGDVVSIDKKKNAKVNEFEHCLYFKSNSFVGVRLLDDSIAIEPITEKAVAIHFMGQSMLLGRQRLAEFLHVSLSMIDPEEQYKPDGDIPGFNYD